MQSPHTPLAALTFEVVSTSSVYAGAAFHSQNAMEPPAAAAPKAPHARPEDDGPTKVRKTRIFKTFGRQAQDLFKCHPKQIDAFLREVGPVAPEGR